MIRDGKWVNPRYETYGASVDIITDHILGYSGTIPAIAYGGIKRIAEIKEIITKIIN